MKKKLFSPLKKAFFALVAGFLFSLPVYAQNITVKGFVKDAKTGEEIIGASIAVQGTTLGTVSDIDGNFTLSAPQGSTISVTFLGYKTKEFKATTNMVTVDLEEDAKLLNEVLVIGYGTVKKNDATGSVTAIKPDEMNKGLVVNAQDAMVGKIAGVNVTSNDGSPGGGATIRIRGGSSLSASNDPLIVIDGLAMDNNGIKGVANPLSMINPADIETFTVLKDASATAIYGSRASNGVIIITTKKGSVGSKPHFSYEGNGSAGILMNRIEVMNASEFTNHVTKYFPEKAGSLGSANTDWQDQVYRTALSTDHNFSVSGGLENMPYRVSLGYTNQNGIVKTSNMNRVTAAINVSPTFFDKHLTVNLNTKGMLINNRYADGGVVGSALAFDPTRPVNDNTYLSYGGYYQTPYSIEDWKDPEWTKLTNTNTPQNPVALINLKDDRAKSKAFVGNIEGDYKIHGFEDLRLHANFGADYSYGKQTTVISPYSYSNNYYGWDGYELINKYNLSFNAYAQYNKELNENNHFDIMGGYEWQHFYRDGNADGAGKYQATHPEHPNEVYGVYTDKWATENFLVSFFGRTNWSAYNKYLFTATVRSDMSSRFKKDKRTGIFPSFAFAWKMKEEGFLQGVDVLSDLKLRLGWGITGQQELNQGDYPALILYKKAQQYADYSLGEKDANGNYIYSKPLRPSPYNLDLTWEKTTTYNAGFDFGFLGQRLTGSLDFYYRLTNDLISVVDKAAGTSFTNQFVSNIGSLSNTGAELMLNAVAIDRKELKWNLGFNATWNTNKIVSLTTGEGSDYYVATGGISSGTGNTIQRHQQGYAANTFWVYETTVTKDGYWEIVNQDGNVDEKDNPIINEKDKVPFHKAAPDFIFGLSSKWQYKNFDLGISLRANIGNYVYNDVKAGSMQPLKTIEREGAFTNIMKNSVPSYAAISGSETINVSRNAFFVDRFVENASFLRCDNITLGYTFPKWKTLNARLYGTVQNPFVITGYTGLDPEVIQRGEKIAGIDNNIYPRSMTVIVGLSLQF